MSSYTINLANYPCKKLSSNDKRNSFLLITVSSIKESFFDCINSLIHSLFVSSVSPLQISSGKYRNRKRAATRDLFFHYVFCEKLWTRVKNFHIHRKRSRVLRKKWCIKISKGKIMCSIVGVGKTKVYVCCFDLFSKEENVLVSHRWSVTRVILDDFQLQTLISQTLISLHF